MTMRRAAREETHILTLNKVGVERNDKTLRENVARHVGLQMPQSIWVNEVLAKFVVYIVNL